MRVAERVRGDDVVAEVPAAGLTEFVLETISDGLASCW
jgi:hypothetical protein